MVVPIYIYICRLNLHHHGRVLGTNVDFCPGVCVCEWGEGGGGGVVCVCVCVCVCVNQRADFFILCSGARS